jgi:hypothetical protein
MTAEKANFKVNLMATANISEYQKALRKSTNLRPIYFDQVLNYINNKIEDVDLKERIIEVAKKYPHSALSRFVSNFELIRSTCLKQMNAEKNKEVVARIRPEVKPLTAEDLLDIQEDLELDSEKAKDHIELSEEIQQNVLDIQSNQEADHEKISHD